LLDYFVFLQSVISNFRQTLNLEKMYELQNLMTTLSWFMPVFVCIVVWDIVWRLLALWRAGRNNEPIWFICIAIFNTVGILPIIYILLDKKKKNENKQN